MIRIREHPENGSAWETDPPEKRTQNLENDTKSDPDPQYWLSQPILVVGKMVESKKALPKEPRMNGLDSSPPHSRVLDNSLHLYTALQGFHRYNTSQIWDTLRHPLVRRYRQMM
jgi:hypothetical protein